MTKRTRVLYGGLVCGALLALSVPAMAIPITGKLALDGRFTVGPTFLNFCDSTTVGPCPAAPGNWNPPASTLSPAIAGDFGPLYVNDPNGGAITNLNNVNAPVGTLLPGNGILFLTFTPYAALPAPDIQLYLTLLFAGVGGSANCGAAPAPGQTCTPILPPGAGLSAVTFLNTAGGNSSATVSANGRARRVSTNEFDDLLIVFSTTFNTPFQQVLSDFGTAGSLTQTYSGTFTATVVPEPMTMALIGLGLFAFAVFSRRLARKI